MSKLSQVDWKKTRLDQVIDQFIVPMRDKPPVWAGDIPWCRIEDFEGKYLYGSKSHQYVDAGLVKSMNLKVFPAGTLLCSCSATLGICTIAARPLVSNQTFIGLVPKRTANTEFLYYKLTALAGVLQGMSSGTTIAYLPRSRFESLEIELPPLAQQDRIAEILSTLDEAIEQTEALIAKHQQIKAGLMHDLFTRGVTPDGHLRPTREQAPDLYKESPLGWIPKEWEVVATETKVDVIDPQPDHRTPPEVLDGYPYVGIGDVMPTGELDFSHARKVSGEAYRRQLHSFDIHPGAFIFGKIGTLGQPTRIPHERFFAVSANVVLLTTNIKNDADFAFWIYSSPFIDSQALDSTNTTSQPALGIQRIRKFNIPWPIRIEERNDIVLRLAKERYKDNTLDIADAGAKVKALINEHLIDLGINPRIPPIELLADDFIANVQKHAQSDPEAKASEMEHAIRKHCTVHFDEDPAFYKRLSEKLEKLIQEHQNNWQELAEGYEQIRNEAMAGRTDTIEGLSKEATTFYDYVVQLAFDGGDVPGDSVASLKKLMARIVETMQGTIDIIDFWKKPIEVKRLRGDIDTEILLANIPQLTGRHERIAVEIVKLAEKRHAELTK